jgi:hypothetical protein
MAMRPSSYVDLATDMADDMDRRDVLQANKRDTVEHRTTAEVMRSNGTSEERIVRFFGYSPLALDVEMETVEMRLNLRDRQRDVIGS